MLSPEAVHPPHLICLPLRRTSTSLATLPSVISAAKIFTIHHHIEPRPTSFATSLSEILPSSSHPIYQSRAPTWRPSSCKPLAHHEGHLQGASHTSSRICFPRPFWCQIATYLSRDISANLLRLRISNSKSLPSRSNPQTWYVNPAWSLGTAFRCRL